MSRRLAALILLAAVPAAAQPAVNVPGWADHVAPAALAAFTAETGIAVACGDYPALEMAETRLPAGGSGFDVVAVAGPVVERLAAAGALAPLDLSPQTVAGLDLVVAQALAASNPGLVEAVPCSRGTTGIGCDAAAVTARLGEGAWDSWSMLFDPAQAAKLADCGIAMVGAPEEAAPIRLDRLGRDPNAGGAGSIDAATAALAAIRPFVSKIDSDAVRASLANGDACAAIAWSGDVLQAAEQAAGRGAEIAFAIPAEGAFLWIDAFTMPTDAPNPKAARAFIAFMQRPGIAALNVDRLAYASGAAGRRRWPIPRRGTIRPSFRPRRRARRSMSAPGGTRPRCAG